MSQQCYSLTITWNNDGQFAQTVLKYQFDDAGYSDSSTAGQALITAFKANKQTGILSVLPTKVSLLSYKARAIDTFGGFEAVSVAAAGTSGARAGVQQCSAVNPVIIWYPFNNSKTRGKTFLPAVTDSDCMDGHFQGAFRTAVGTFITNFLPDMVLAGGGTPTAKFVIRQRLPTLSYLPVQYGALSDTVGTLRKRQRPNS